MGKTIKNKEKKILKINARYIPKNLSKKDKKKQLFMLLKSRNLYKKGKYFTRKKVKSFPQKKSNHILNAEKIYNVDKIDATKELSYKTGCTINTLKEIIRKGEGAYYSSGSRPNQTSQSWGKARLASAISGGKASLVDFYLLKKGCKNTSKVFKYARNAKKKYGKGN
jgi:hypothetical protein